MCCTPFLVYLANINHDYDDVIAMIYSPTNPSYSHLLMNMIDVIVGTGRSQFFGTVSRVFKTVPKPVNRDLLYIVCKHLTV